MSFCYCPVQTGYHLVFLRQLIVGDILYILSFTLFYHPMSGLIWMSASVISRTEKTFAWFKSQTHTDGRSLGEDDENEKDTRSSHPLWLYCTVWCQVWSESLPLPSAGENDLCCFLWTLWSVYCISNIHSGQSGGQSL